MEEAGVRGRIGKTPLGEYRYIKSSRDGADWPCLVTVFPLFVTTQRREWPEAAERARRWFCREEAALRVTEPDLAAPIRDFSIDRFRVGERS